MTAREDKNNMPTDLQIWGHKNMFIKHLIELDNIVLYNVNLLDITSSDTYFPISRSDLEEYYNLTGGPWATSLT